MSLKSVNALTHYTDYTIGHVHGGALGWNGFVAFGMIYWLVPRLWRVPVHSVRLMAAHFWVATIGIVLYITSMWVSGITQGLMWRAMTPQGTLLYPDFVETVMRLKPFYYGRLLGGLLYVGGLLVMVYNLKCTFANAKKTAADLSDTSVQVAVALDHTEDYSHHPNPWHRKMEGAPVLFTVLVLVSVLVGGPLEFIPLALLKSSTPTIASVHPYTPLEIEGRDIYIREGCYNCHSQMIRPFKEEVARYGDYSRAGEFVYDHPFQFGSKRTGPDLQRVGGKYPSFWHYRHMAEPTSTSAGSIMPKYQWLYSNDLDTSLTERKLQVLKSLGVPYSDSEVTGATAAAGAQAGTIAAELRQQGATGTENLEKKEIVALIAYLQRLGTDFRKSQTTEVK